MAGWLHIISDGASFFFVFVVSSSASIYIHILVHVGGRQKKEKGQWER